MGSSCYFCKKSIEENDRVCPFCGKKQAVDEKMVTSAKQGDQQAITDIYILSYQKVFFTVRSMIKDEDAIEDLVQDTFIKAFSSLESLHYEEGKFQAWLCRIAHNMTVNYVRKRKEVLFSEMESDDSDSDIGIDFEDERTENLPEAVIDGNETKRLIDEMLNTLSEEQRLAVGMYYYEQRSVNEIAEEMGVSVNTVKSRLSYARKKIEVQVRALEKQGTKLYGLSPIPFLMLLFRNQDMQAVAPDAATAEKTVGAILAAKAALGAAGQGEIATAVAQEASAVGQAAAAQSGASAASTAAAQGGASAGQAAAGQAAATGKAVVTTGKATAAVGKGIAVKATAGVLAVGLAGGAVLYATNQKPMEEIGTETEIVLATETEEPSEIIEIETETEIIVIIEETETETESETETETELEPEPEPEPEYTFTSLDTKMFVQEASDIMDLPYWDGNTMGTLSVGDVVEITGQCNETWWYQINYNGSTGYVYHQNMLDVSTPDVCTHSWYDFYVEFDNEVTTNKHSDDTVFMIERKEKGTYWYMCEECSLACTDTECDHEWVMGYTGDGSYEGSCGGITYTIYEDSFYYVCAKCGAYWVY